MNYDNSSFESYQENSTPLLTSGKSPEELRQQRLIIITVIVAAIIFISLSILAISYLAQPTTNTARIRDIMIIFVALEFMLLGVAMVIMIIQLATLINLLQNELQPLLESTNETANTLRGTVIFLSDNLSEPVIKLNESMAAIIKLLEIIGFVRRR